MRSVRQQLLIWLLSGMLISTLLAGLALYFSIREESSELFDYQLRQIATALPSQLLTQPIALDELDSEEDIIVQVWDKNGLLTFTSTTSHVLPRILKPGLSTVKFQDSHWRVFSISRRSSFIQVAQDISARDELVIGATVRSLLPFLALIPALALLIGVVVGRVMQQLQQVTKEVNGRSENVMQLLPIDNIPREIKPLLDAINNLLERLDAVLSAQRAFIADAAHELRSPLTALKLQLQLAERAESKEQRSSAFAKLHDRINRSIHLVHQMLTLARHEPQVEDKSFEKIDLVQLVQQVVSDQSTLAQTRQIDVVIKVDDAPFMIINGQFEWLRIMLGNLVDNALRYTPVGGRVDVMALAKDDHFLLRVVDTGPGIPFEERERVFDRFYRGQAEASGSGLGLAIVKSIANQHGATIHMDDNPLQQGLVVTIIILGS